MLDYMEERDASVTVVEFYKFALRHHVTPEDATEMLAGCITSADHAWMKDVVPYISLDTWKILRTIILSLRRHVDYVWYDSQAIKIKDEVEIALFRLGETSARVACSLAELGIRGEPGKSCWCPVANYLRHTFRTDAVSVSGMCTSVNGAELLTPMPVAKFIDEMDDLQHLDLQSERLERALQIARVD